MLHPLRCLVFAGTVLSVLADLPAQADPVAHHLVQVHIRDSVSLDRLTALDLDLAACTALELPSKLVDVIATDADVARIRDSGLEFEIAIRNLEEHHARELAGFGNHTLGLTPPIGQGGMGGHYTLAEMEAILDSFAHDFPAICAPKVSIGRSLEGRDIWMVKISDAVATDEPEPEMCFDALHHAREPVGMTTTLQFMSELLSGYGSDPEATFIVDNRELYFVPCVNPDGYEHNRRTNPGGGGLWRKNRRGDASGVFGVDVNRNYPTGWNAPNGGNSTNTGSETYRGTAPLSEPESAAIEAFFAAHSFTQVNSCHTYTEILLRPWGWQSGDPPNNAEYVAVGDRLTSSNGIAHGSAADLLYIAAGTTLDHAHTAHGALGWSPELGRSNEGGFWPTPPNQIAIAQRHQHMFRQMALTAGPLLSLAAIAVQENGGDGDGVVEPGESATVRVTVANAGLLAATASQLTLTALSNGVQIANGQAALPPIARLGSVDNSSNLLQFVVPANFTDPFARVRVALAGGGRTISEDVAVPLADLRIAVETDFEVDHGFARGTSTATTGLWERAAPVQTTSGSRTIQPGSDRSPSGTLCWITDGRGGSAGTYDVDNGHTDLVSPALDLSHLGFAEVRFWRWYVDSVDDDALEVWVSNDDGQSWTSLLQTTAATTAWTETRLEIPLALTATMRLRVRAQDNNASLVEAGIDDFAVAGFAPHGDLTLLSSGAIGSTIRVGLNGNAGALGHVLLSPSTVAPITIPGIAGALVLDPALIVNLAPRVFPAGGYASVDISIPNLANLRGADLFFQQFHADGTSYRLGNAQRVVFR